MKSYTFGLLQTSAFKGLKGFTAFLLKPYDLTTYEWALLGILYDNPKGLSPTLLAETLSVSKPFITKVIKRLSEADWVEKSTTTDTDMRITKFTLTPMARKKVPKIEKRLKTEMKKMLTGVPKLQLLAYYMVLKHLSKKLSASVDTTAFEVNSEKYYPF